MKLYTFILFILSSSFCFSQNRCEDIRKLDDFISQIDLGDHLNSDVYFEGLQDVFIPAKDQGYKITDNKLLKLIEDSTMNLQLIRSRLDCIKNTETITWLEHVVSEKIRILEELTNPLFDHYPSPSSLKILNKQIHRRIDEIMKDEYSFYKFSKTSKKILTGIYFEHSNDVLSLYSNDRDMTGAFRLELLTDKFKFRIIPSHLDKIFNPHSRSWYGFQSIFLGGEGYSPNLDSNQLTNDMSNDMSFDTLDRPFASFQYFGWARYNIYRKGNFRYSNQIKLGSIGKLTPSNVQYAIHRDITVNTSSPVGWKSQIANGGRTAFSIEPALEWSPWHRKKMLGLFYVSGIIEGKFGNPMTSLDCGINISTRSLKERGGKEYPLVYQGKKNNKANFFIFNYKPSIRYVKHNSMLEGYGILKRQPDEDEKSPIDPYFLAGGVMDKNSKEYTNALKRGEHPNLNGFVNRWIQIHELTFAINFRYMSLILKQNYMSPEFEIKNPDGTPIDEKLRLDSNGDPWNEKKWNHFGTIGFLFKVN